MAACKLDKIYKIYNRLITFLTNNKILFYQRIRKSKIREIHGDLYLANIFVINDERFYLYDSDIDFSVNPTKIHIRKEFAKTRTSRDIYLSDEATYYLKQWIDWKYRDKGKKGPTKGRSNNDLVFGSYNIKGAPNPKTIYIKTVIEFQKLLTIVGMDERKEEGIHKRRKITLHSFRRFVKTVISDQTNQDYSEWFLGHSKSPYYTKKESERREIYATKCMKYLTYLDYTTLEARGKSIEANLQEKDREIAGLKEKYDADIALLKNQMRSMQELLSSIATR